MSWKKERAKIERYAQQQCGKTGHEWEPYNADQDQISKYRKCRFCGKIEKI